MIHRLQEIQSIYISQNRLVEGKDYKRAEWLIGDGTAYMTDTSENSFSSDLYNLDFGNVKIFDSTQKVGLFYNWVKNNTHYAYLKYINSAIKFMWAVTTMNYNVDVTLADGNLLIKPNIYSFTQVNGICVNNNTSYRIGNSRFFNIGTVGSGAQISAPAGIGITQFVQSYVSDGVVRRELKPCQLLRSIPATLDANNIARTAGECGMVDSISGKFYGNVASSGSFSVEGLDESGTVEDTRLHQIYKNKLVEGEDYIIGEWLKADIPIGAIMMQLPINSKNFEFERNFIQLKNTSYFSTYADSSGNYSYFIQDYYTKIYSSKLQRTIFTGNNLGSGVHTIIANDNGIVISSATNTTTLRWYGNPQRILFNNASNANINAIYRTSSIKVDGVTRYAPCRLLRPIPRNLDAQCKSRVAGECGMIDLISGRFYGNVASSGTFSLAWDEWLKDCTIQFDAMKYYQGMPMEYPPTINYYARVEVAKLPDELTDFGFVKLSKTQIVLGENTWANSPTLLGNDKWATVRVNMGGGSGGNVVINGTSLEQQAYVSTITACTINLRGIMQINKIDFTNYADADHTYSWTFTRGVDEETNKQYLVDDFEGNKIYQD